MDSRVFFNSVLAGLAIAISLFFGGCDKIKDLISISDEWYLEEPFPGRNRSNPVAFSLNNYGYVGLGWNEGGLNDFWRFDSWDLDTIPAWDTVAYFPGAGRKEAVSFTIGNYAYVGLGGDYIKHKARDTFYNDFYKYDGMLDQWTKVATFPGLGRMGGMAFSDGQYGYVLGGRSVLENGTEVFAKDFWLYNPLSNEWSRQPDFQGEGRQNGVAFYLQNTAYVGTGFGTGGKNYDDFWLYNPKTQAWSRGPNFLGGSREGAIAYATDTLAYVGLGWKNGVLMNDFWEFAPKSNSWAKRKDFAGSARTNSACFSFGRIGYVGVGYNSRDFWFYQP